MCVYVCMHVYTCVHAYTGTVLNELIYVIYVDIPHPMEWTLLVYSVHSLTYPHTRILMPFKDCEPKGLKVDNAVNDISSPGKPSEGLGCPSCSPQNPWIALCRLSSPGRTRLGVKKSKNNPEHNQKYNITKNGCLRYAKLKP